MEDPMIVDSTTDPTTDKGPKKQLKRKRQSFDLNLFANNKETLKSEFQQEINSLFEFYKEFSNPSSILTNAISSNNNTNSVIACLLEEKEVSFSNLVEEIHEKVKEREGITLASVKSSVLFVGQRIMYGISNADADVLEDESESCLWCWETRDLKLFPQNMRGILSMRRLARKKIHERISALSATLSAMENSEDLNAQVKASSNLGKVLNLEGIRSLVEKLKEKNNTEMAEKEAKLKEKELIKEMEKSKKNAEKEKKKIDRQAQKEKLQNEKEQKRLQEEAEKEQKRKEKEEAELNKQLKKQQEEAEREQKRREKEEAELKKQNLIKKQATMMERFLIKCKKSNKSTENSENESPNKEKAEGLNCKKEMDNGAVTLLMDNFFSNKENLSSQDLWSSHLNTWKKPSSQNKPTRWGIRKNPKKNFIKELKLQRIAEHEIAEKNNSHKKMDQGPENNFENILDEIKEPVPNDVSNVGPTRLIKKKLLQFDKSHRPAYYGTWSKKSSVIGARRPFKMDPELDYEVDSDEEWEEEDPGESLSDCEKDNEEEMEEEIPKEEEEEESEDSFVVPDGYLSDDEGIESKSQSKEEGEETLIASPQSEEIRAFFKQQKVLNNLTEQALKKSQPLIISNLNHSKLGLLEKEDLTGLEKLEQICIQALCMKVYPNGAIIDLPGDQNANIDHKVANNSPNQVNNKSSSSPSALTAVSDSDLPEFVRLIQSCPHGLNKLVDLLLQNFSNISKTQLRNKVREISSFNCVDGRWEVKKEVLDRLGLPASPSPEKRPKKSIAMYFSKRCLPPPEGDHNNSETTPPSFSKSRSVLDRSNGPEISPIQPSLI
ncbi:hypothetical protein LUZ60_013739 [Juncus effusus]|nr:hypothetical protein LUZ60_013739 [Juncus effusus]